MIKSPKTILRLLRSKNVNVKIHELEKGFHGFVYTENGIIHISNKQPIKQRVSTLIHECLHILNPKQPEPMVAYYEKEVLAKLSKKEYNLLKMYVA